MNDSISYKQSSKLNIRRAHFDYLGARFSGQGWLRWDPFKGAEIDIGVQQIDGELPEYGVLGKRGPLRPEDYTRLQLEVHGFDWVVARRAALFTGAQFALQIHSALSLESVPSLLCRFQPLNAPDEGYFGHVCLALKRGVHLSSRVDETTLIDDQQVEVRGSRTGIRAKVNDVTISGRLDEEARIKLYWGDPKSRLSRAKSWKFGEALAIAVWLSTGCHAPILERELTRNGRTYREVRCRREPKRLETLGLEWFDLTSAPTAEECLQLALALNSDPKLLTLARSTFVQLIDATQQRTWETTELVVALILEAMLRKLDESRFKKGKKYQLSPAMKRLRKEHFPAISKTLSHDAVQVSKNLRHRNAHPDWNCDDDRFGYKALSSSTEEMTLLSRFYGRVIFEMAGLSSVAERISLATN